MFAYVIETAVETQIDMLPKRLRNHLKMMFNSEEKSETQEKNENKKIDSLCLVCGAEKATLAIHSKALPPYHRTPYFPFLDSVDNGYPDENNESGGLDENGKGLACNVCYSFLIQQWNTYETSQTPVAKRVYWLKQRSCSKTKDDSNLLNERIGFSVIKTEIVEKSSTDCKSANDESRSSLKGISRCGTCSKSIESVNCQVIHTRPQINLGTPFFPSIVTLVTSEDIDKQGKVIVCIRCYDFLNYQWLKWEKKRFPIQGRSYNLPSSPCRTKQLCPLCNNCFLLEEGQLVNIDERRTRAEPCFPFIRNYLETIPGWLSSSNNETISVCLRCSNDLHYQWEMFEEDKRAHEDRVYSGDVECQNDKSNICPFCSEHMGSKSKFISTSLRANKYFSTIQINRENESLIHEGHKSFKVCNGCFQSLQVLYNRFEKCSVPRGLRCYVIINGAFECYVGCSLCDTQLIPDNVQWIEIDSVTGPKTDIQKPYFPCFSRHALPYTRLIGCSLCYSNLCAQWDAYEEDGVRCVASCVVSPHQRTYNVDQFVCYGCSKKNSKDLVGAVDLNNYPSLVKTIKPSGSIHVFKYAVVCVECQQNASGVNIHSTSPKTNAASRSSIVHDVTPVGIAGSKLCRASSSTLCETSVVMKATATVQPLKTSQTVSSHSPGLSLSSRMSHRQSTDHVTPNGTDDASEGSFAAALRKLAREALSTPGDTSSGISAANERKQIMAAGSRGPPVPPVSFHTGIHHSPLPRSRDAVERSELSHTFAETDNPSRRLSQQQQQQQQQQQHQKLSSSNGVSRNRIGPYPPRDDHQTKDNNSSAPLRDSSDCDRIRSRHAPFSHAAHKERTASNVGLVHPQRARKLNPEESKSTVSPISGHHHRDSQHNPTTFFRPHSPEERRYSSIAPPSLTGIHSSGPSCPVHGAESSHSRRSDSPVEHNDRIPPRLPLDPMSGLPRHQHSPSSSLADMRSASIQHHRLQDEMFALPRHPAEVIGRFRDSYPHNAIDEDFRRRGALEWPWNAPSGNMPPHPYYDAEQYRRHFVATMRGHDHHPSSTQMMLGHPHYIPRDYPSHSVDPYIHSGVLPSDYYSHRHEHPLPPAVSPRMVDYFRHHEQQHYERAREYLLGESLNERLSNRHPHVSDRGSLAPGLEDAVSKRGNDHSLAQVSSSSVDIKPVSLLRDFRPETAQVPHRRTDHQARVQKNEPVVVDHNEKDNYLQTLGLVSHHLQYRRSSRPSLLPPSCKPLDGHGTTLESSRAQAVGSRLEGLSETPSPSITQYENTVQSDDGLVRSEESESEDVSMIDGDDQKHKFMMSLGLVTHSKHKLLEEDYDMKRWDRKMRKYRGRPRKKLKKEASEDSGEHRGPGEIDFYSGPITRHKQQLLQEQESLIGQTHQNDKDGCQTRNNEDVTMDTMSSDKMEPSRHITHRPHIHEQQQYETRQTTPNGFHHQRQNKNNEPKAKIPRLVDLNESRSRSVDHISKGSLDSHITWPGIDIIAESYATYKRGLEREEDALKRGCDELRSVEDELSLQSDVIKREMMMLHDRKLQLGESLQRSRRDIDRVHELLRALTSNVTAPS